MMDRFAFFKSHQLTVVANMAVTTTCEIILWSTVLSAYASPYTEDGEFDSSQALGFALVVVPSLALYSLTMVIVAAVFFSDPGVLARNRGRDPGSALSAETMSEDLEPTTRERLQSALDAVPRSSRARMLSMDDTRVQLKSYEVNQARAKALADSEASDGDGSAETGVLAHGEAGAASQPWVVIDPAVAWRDARGTPMLVDGSKWCRTCLVWRPAGASHCGEIGRCVKKFDHYCPAVGTAVGGGNHVLFSWMTVAAAGLVVHGLACAVGHLAWLFMRSWTFTGLWTSEALNLSTEAIAVALILVMIIRPMGTPCFRFAMATSMIGCGAVGFLGAALACGAGQRAASSSKPGTAGAATGLGSRAGGSCRRALLRCGACLDRGACGPCAATARWAASLLGSQAAGASEKKTPLESSASGGSPIAPVGARVPMEAELHPGRSAPEVQPISTAAGSTGAEAATPAPSSAAEATKAATVSSITAKADSPTGSPPSSGHGHSHGNGQRCNGHGHGHSHGNGHSHSHGQPVMRSLPLWLQCRQMLPTIRSPFWRHTLFVVLPNSLVLMAGLGSVLLAVVFAPTMAATFRNLVEMALKPRFTDLSGGANGTVPSVVAAAGDAAKQARASAMVLATEYGPSGTAEALDGPWGNVFMGAAITLLWCCSRIVMASCSSPLSGITGSGAAVMCGPCAPVATALGCCPGGAFASDATAMMSEVLSSVVCWGAALCVLMPRWWNFDPTGRYETEFQSWEGPWVLLAIAVGAALSMMMVPFAINHWHLVAAGKTTKGLSVGNPFHGTRWPLAVWRAALDGAAIAASAAGIGSGLESAHTQGDARQRAGRDLGAGV